MAAPAPRCSGPTSAGARAPLQHVEGKRVLAPTKGHLTDALTETRKDLHKVNDVVLCGEIAGEHLFF